MLQRLGKLSRRKYSYPSFINHCGLSSSHYRPDLLYGEHKILNEVLCVLRSSGFIPVRPHRIQNSIFLLKLVMDIDSIIPFQYRLAFGLTFFFIFGLYDWVKNPQNPTRVREYGFLASCALISVIFAIFHDLITFNISYEYFEIAKDLGKDLKFFPKVVILAAKASYWVGLIVGIILVIANNPRKRLEPLPYKTLYRYLVYPFVSAITMALLGVLTAYSVFPYFTANGGEQVLKYPMRFEIVAFIHWGTYIGGAIGAVVGGVQILKNRIRVP